MQPQLQCIPTPVMWVPRASGQSPTETLALFAGTVTASAEDMGWIGQEATETLGIRAGDPVASAEEKDSDHGTETETLGILAGTFATDDEYMIVEQSSDETLGVLPGTVTPDDVYIFVDAANALESVGILAGTPVASASMP